MNNDVPSSIKERVSEVLKLQLNNFFSVSGGCISHGGQLQTPGGNLFIKWNDVNRYPKMFEAEAKGLQLLKSANTLHIPEVILVGETGSFQFIVLEWIESTSQTKGFWNILGEQLALLHQHSHSLFGLDHDNYIGSLPQKNTQNKSWVEFFISQRLQPQVELLKVDAKLQKNFDALYKELPQLLPSEKPSLLHGDLWSGNLIADNQGMPCLIDPAIYFGNREVEIAFTQLFGGFDQSFYESYENVFPLVAGFDERVDLYNLYPLLVHTNLFGGSYLLQVKSIVSRFV
jgi:protein-ribulosamine 3-kinase